jgi:membrane protein YdbS with pleckstrin-like domain
VEVTNLDKNAEKVIRPPVEQITSGTIFKPSKAYLYKMQLQNVLAFLIVYISIMLCFIAGAYIAQAEPPNPSAIQILNDYFWTVNLWTIGLNLLWLVPALALTPVYFNSLEYSVKAESGSSMPEVYSKQGIIAVTRRHIPFRTITNISSKAGPFDRLFNIGTVDIETAGNSGAQKGPETALQGLVFYEEVRDFILRELRRFKEPYVVGTEGSVVASKSTTEATGADGEMLATLKEIRDLLRAKQDNL